MRYNQKIKLMSIAGARPNFMKLASIANAVKAHNESTSSQAEIEHIIVHTGQHYDQKMSESFFDDLGIPEPNINLGVGSGSHAEQTAEIMKKFEPVLLKEQPNVLLVVGDVNSTIACTLVASKIQYPETASSQRPIIVHVEAGLRSFDRYMPEEINRMLTDTLSDMLFVTEQSGIDNLRNDGVSAEKVHFVGNVMIDTLKNHLEKSAESDIKRQLGIQSDYALLTLHRPSNVDSVDTLKPLITCFIEISKLIKVVFSVHPRTQNNLKKFGLFKSIEDTPDITLTPPLGYLDFLNLTQKATMVITDSGGIQEETTFLQIPCITLRNNTERPVTVIEGSNYLIGTSPEKIINTVRQILNGNKKEVRIPELWDGKAGERIISIICNNTYNTIVR